MSKMDNLRAMREARYEAAQKRTSATPARPAAATTPKAAKPTAKAAQPARVESQPEAATEALCGHRNMSGRTCTREHGHAAKSHRYS